MRRRRAALFITLITVGLIVFGSTVATEIERTLVAPATPQVADVSAQEAAQKLESLEVKGRAPKTGYTREAFGGGWKSVQGCSTRNIILYRDLSDVTLDGACDVRSGSLNDPYTGEVILFDQARSSEVQIDHVVALSDAWQKGAQLLTAERREQLANDPLELLAVSGKENQAKGDGDAATWLPKNRAFRCEYIERQIEIKVKYELWVTAAEKEAMAKVLAGC
jgi:hypothetical protein